MLREASIVAFTGRRYCAYFDHLRMNFRQARHALTLISMLTVLVAGCGGKEVPLPRGYADGHGGWCEPDLGSARRAGEEAMFRHLCEFTADSDRNKLVGQTSNGLLQGVSITRRFNCEQRRLVEVTNILYWERAPTDTMNSREDRMVPPNTPVESAMDFACSQE